MRIRMSQSRHTVVLPAGQSGGRHGKPKVGKERSAGIIRNIRPFVYQDFFWLASTNSAMGRRMRCASASPIINTASLLGTVA